MGIYDNVYVQGDKKFCVNSYEVQKPQLCALVETMKHRVSCVRSCCALLVLSEVKKKKKSPKIAVRASHSGWFG